MKRILLLLFSLLMLIALKPIATVQAQQHLESWKFETPEMFYDALTGDDSNLETSHFVGMGAAGFGFGCYSLGLCSNDPNQQAMFIQNSAVGKMASAIDDMYTHRPADTGLWIADTGRSLGFIPPKVNAQGIGIGFSGLESLLPVWKVFRNIAYLLMALVMIILGFLVMFRKKIDPKTVVTAQNAIPRVIIALILITFSYAIVGLMIDIMYIVLFLVIALFKSTGLLSAPQSIFNYQTPEALYGQGGLLANFAAVEWDPYKILFGGNFFGLDISTFDPTVTTLVSGTVGGLLIAFGVATGGVTMLATGVPGLLLVGMPLIHVILGIAMLFLFFRLLAFFLTSYIQIIVALLLAPLQLLMEAFPGSTSFSSWFNNLVSNLAVFPIGAGMFMLANIFTNIANAGGADGGGAIWAPPFATLSPNVTSVSALVAVGILFAIPQVAGSIKEALKAKPTMPMLDFGGAGTSAGSLLSSFYYLKMLAPSGFMQKLTGADKAPKHEG